MDRYKIFRGFCLLLVVLGFFCNSVFAAGMRIVPSSSQVTPGEDFFFDVVAEGVPDTGLSGVQFHLNVAPTTGNVSGIPDLSQAGTGDVAVATPLLVSPPVSGRSGIGDFFWNGKGNNGILVMDNETLTNGSGLYSFAHTSGATTISGSGSVARFAVRVGSDVKADRLDISLADAMLMNGGPAYPLDYATGASVQLRCVTKTPSLLGLDRASALTALTNSRLTLGSVYEVNNGDGTRPLNVVLEQSALAGSEVLCQSPVDLAINAPPSDVTNAKAVDKPNDESGAVLLSWTPSASSDTAGFRVYGSGALLKQVAGAAVNGAEIGGLANGVVTSLKVTAYDTFGNESAGVYVNALPLDDVPPVIAIGGLITGGMYRTNITPLVTATDAGSVSWSATLNGSPFGGAAVTADGAYELTVTAVDQAGNRAVKTVSFTIDKTPPTLNVSLPSDGSHTIATELSISGTLSDTGGIKSLTVNGAPVTVAANGQFSYVQPLADGNNTIVIVATDAADNQTTRQCGIIRDTGELVTVDPVPSPTHSTTITLGGTILPGANLNIASASGAKIGPISFPSSGTWSCVVSGLVPGSNDFTLTAYDTIGISRSVDLNVTYASALAAALSADAIASDYRGGLVLSVTNMSQPGAELLVEQYVDTNRNGLIDGGDYAIRSFRVSDGLGSVSRNVQGDEDGAVNSAVRTTLNYYLGNDLSHAPGHYLFRVSSGEDSVVKPFEVTPVTASQVVSGAVSDGTRFIPGAMICLFDKWHRPVMWTSTNDTGEYSLNVKQPGDYRVIPVVYGYAAAEVPISLAAGQTVSGQTLPVSPGTRHVTGKLRDATNGSAVSGVWIQASGANSVGYAMSGDDGGYDLLLPSGQYVLRALSETVFPGTFAKGYVGFGDQALNVSVTGDVAGMDLSLTAGETHVTGQALDAAGNGVAGVPLQARISGTIDSRQPVAYGFSSSSGAYALDLVAGENWEISPDDESAQTLGYIGSIRREYSTSAGPLNGINITVAPITAWIQGSVRNSAAQPLADVAVVLRNADSTITVSVKTAADGTYRLGAFAGSWFVDALTEDVGTRAVPEQNITLVDSQVATVDFAVDTTPPTVIITSPVAGTTGNNRPVLLYSVSDGTVVVKVDGAAVNKVSGDSLDLLANGKHTVRVEATDASGNFSFAEIAFTVAYKPLSITTSSLSQATLGSGYAKGLSATGGVKPYSWSITSGSLPTGMSLNATTGVISGAPTASGAFALTVQVQDSQGTTANVSLTLNVVIGPLSVTTSSLSQATLGSGYAKGLSATGGVKPYSWSITSGSLPTGMSLNATTGVISGAPTASGSFAFTVQVQDSQGTTAGASLTLNVVIGPLSVTTSSLSQATLGSGYSRGLAATGGVKPYSWSITSGSLPTGMSLNATTGVISGTPGASGSFALTVQVRDSQGTTASAALTLNVVIGPLSVTTSSLSQATLGSGYAKGLSATGGVKPYSWSITSGSLPTGMSLNATTGVISGAPTASGAFAFTVQVQDSQGTTAGASLTLNVVIGPLSITTSSLSQATLGSGYAKGLSATGGVKPYSWSITSGALPTGMSLNATTGVISGAPTASGSFAFTVQVRDSQGTTAGASLTLNVVIGPLSVTTSSLSQATLGSGYSRGLAATGGVKPYSWSITSGALPSGMSLNATTGVISGTPGASGSFALTVQVRDSQGTTASAALTLNVVIGPLSVTTSSLSQATLGSGYSRGLAATGGVKPYSWSITSGALPSGMSLNATTGVISGAPTASGAFAFTVQVQDSQGTVSAANLSLDVK